MTEFRLAHQDPVALKRSQVRPSSMRCSVSGQHRSIVSISILFVGPASPYSFASASCSIFSCVRRSWWLGSCKCYNTLRSPRSLCCRHRWQPYRLPHSGDLWSTRIAAMFMMACHSFATHLMASRFCRSSQGASLPPCLNCLNSNCRAVSRCDSRASVGAFRVSSAPPKITSSSVFFLHTQPL